MKTCPRCYRVVDDEVIDCDCGFTFLDAAESMSHGASQILHRLFMPRCPACGQRHNKRVGTFVDSTWEVLYYIEGTYQCVNCHHIFSRRNYLLSVVSIPISLLGLLGLGGG